MVHPFPHKHDRFIHSINTYAFILSQSLYYMKNNGIVSRVPISYSDMQHPVGPRRLFELAGEEITFTATIHIKKDKGHREKAPDALCQNLE